MKQEIKKWRKNIIDASEGRDNYALQGTLSEYIQSLIDEGYFIDSIVVEDSESWPWRGATSKAHKAFIVCHKL